MTPRHARRIAVLIALAAGAVMAVGVPLGERWRACRAPASEACAWGKALFPVSLAVGAALGAFAAMFVFLVVRVWQQRPRRRDAG